MISTTTHPVLTLGRVIHSLTAEYGSYPKFHRNLSLQHTQVMEHETALHPKFSTWTLVYYRQFSRSQKIFIFHTVHTSIMRTDALIPEIPHFIQFLTLSYNGHHSITASSLGPRDSQFPTVPTSLIWRLLYNGHFSR